jgi:uncharacterized membrane protein YdbT with pleckstrin-like domain
MDLLQGEDLIWSGKPSWRSTMSFYSKWGLIAAVVGAGLGFWKVWIGIVAFLGLALLAVLIGWLARYFTEYTITTKRITIRRGFLSKTEQSAHIERLQNVTITQSLFDRLFKVGTLDFDTAGGDRDAELRFSGISDPRTLRDRIAAEYLKNDAAQGSGV